MSDDKVVKMKLVGPQDVPPHIPLADAYQMAQDGQLLTAVVIGRTPSGEMFFASSDRDLNRVCVDLMLVTSEIMEIAEEQNAKAAMKRAK